MLATDLEEVAGGRAEEEGGAGTEEAVMFELVGDCDGGGAAEYEAASASGKTEEVEATEEEGPGGGLDEVLFWLLFRE